MKIYRVAIQRNEPNKFAPLNYKALEIDARNSACFVLVGIESKSPGHGYDKSRTVLVPWHTISVIDVWEEETAE